jgi:hypothetical protein
VACVTLTPTTTGEWIVEGYRWGSDSAPWHETLIIMLAIAVMAVACVLIFRHLRRREQQPKRVSDQWQTLAVMGELCPRGWQAQITVYGDGAPMPLDAPPARAPLVELEWVQFDGEPQQARTTRRAWARSINGAMQMMVDDRCTDLSLERSAAEGRNPWELD